MARERTDLTADAVKINGIYMEDAISGFTTMNSSGREALTKEIVSNSYKSDGSLIDYTRYPEREIEITFMIASDANGTFRDKYTTLLGMLDGEDVDIQFNDDADKFLTGTIVVNKPDDKYGTFCKGTYTITCANPFRYSTAVYEASPVEYDTSSAQFLINYNGTYPSRPILQAEFVGAQSGGDFSDDGDCGFVAFMDDEENIIQLGNPDAIDLDVSGTAEQVLNRTFTTISGFTTSGGNTWGNKTVAGSSSANQSITDTYWKKGTGQTLKYVKPTYGSGSSWHGPILRYAVSGGEQNFEVSLVHRICCKKAEELGTFEFGAYTSGGVMLAGFVIEKTANGTKGTVRYIVNGVQQGTAAIDLSYYNTNFGYCKRTAVNQTQWYNKKKKKWQTKKIKGAKTRTVVSGYTYTQSNLNSSIRRNGGIFTFKIGNLAKATFNVSGLTEVVPSEYSMHFGQKASKAALNTNAVSSMKITKLAGETFADTLNVFTAGDIVEADCSDASIYLKRAGTEEGQLSPQLGALANDWEDFMLVKGTNIITASWSPWVNTSYKPVLKILYNEVFI
jgi:predicted phage tail component-like protein